MWKQKEIQELLSINTTMKPENKLGTMKPGVTVFAYAREEQLDAAVDKLMAFVEEKTGVWVSFLTGGGRRKDVVAARKMYYAIAWDVLRPMFETVFTYNSIAGKLGQDHSTMMYSLLQHDKQLSIDKQYKQSHTEAVTDFRIILSPTTVEGFIANRIAINKKILELQGHMNFIDKELDARGYDIDETGKPIRR
jgi:hypothetical protein